jgi:hypothetical protein
LRVSSEVQQEFLGARSKGTDKSDGSTWHRRASFSAMRCAWPQREKARWI